LQLLLLLLLLLSAGAAAITGKVLSRIEVHGGQRIVLRVCLVSHCVWQRSALQRIALYKLHCSLGCVLFPCSWLFARCISRNSQSQVAGAAVVLQHHAASRVIQAAADQLQACMRLELSDVWYLSCAGHVLYSVRNVYATAMQELCSL
jgi:hypothetical protein